MLEAANAQTPGEDPPNFAATGMRENLKDNPSKLGLDRQIMTNL